jgi:hypothetical protein
MDVEGRFSISPQALYVRLGTELAPIVVDVRRSPAFEAPAVSLSSLGWPANGMRFVVLIVVIQCKADLERHLVMRDLAVFDMAARLDHFEPANLAQRA